MRRADLEHVIRAAATVADDDEIVVIGSQAILGRLPDAPDALLWSQEADVYPRHRPERAEAVDGALGDGSQFHAAFGYYAPVSRPAFAGRRGGVPSTSGMATDPLHVDRKTWQALDAEQRQLLRPAGLSIEDKLRRGQHLSAQAAALRRAIARDEPSAGRP